MDLPKPFPGIGEFLFDAPLYAVFQFPSIIDLKRFYNGLKDERLDGHCPHCGRGSVFEYTGIYTTNDEWEKLGKLKQFEKIELTCARDEDHKIHFWVYVAMMTVEKVGQTPSLADIANDESKKYSRLLSKEDSAEFHKAIGLAAHGVGIGSYVYMRRIFERLIQKRFLEYRESEGWPSLEDFKRMWMDEKIDLLKGHLPEFLVQNAKIYSILSQGIHELDEDECKTFFPVAMRTIVLILEEDQHKKGELAERDRLKRAISEFQAKDKDPTEAAK